MNNLSYDALSLLLWLKDEAIDISTFQRYPSSLDAQAYLPMSFGAQQNAIKELTADSLIETMNENGTLFYRVVGTGESSLSAKLDIYDGSGVIIEDSQSILQSAG